MLVRDLGEFALIERLAERLEKHQGSAPLLNYGIGDDAALWRPTPGWDSVLTTDTLIEGVHFTQQTTPWPDLGWKSLAVNLSDLAAMAAQPRVALVTLGLTGQEEVAAIDVLYDGMAELAGRYGVRVVGGDTVRAPQVQVAMTVIGEAVVSEGIAQVLRRDQARPGDVLAVTGYTGDAAGGLALLLRSQSSADAALAGAHRRPQPRLVESAWLFSRGIRCATDSSDCLVRVAELLCKASGAGAWIDAARLPVSDALRAAFPEAATELALFGGEDYELVMAVDPRRFPELQAAWQQQFTIPLTAVGAFEEADPDRRRLQLRNYQGESREFEHFARPAE